MTLLHKMKQKIQIVEQLIHLYKENPNRLVFSYNSLKADSFSNIKLKKDMSPRKEPTIFSPFQVKAEKVLVSDILSIITSSVNIILSIFGIYLIFLIMYYLIYKSTLSNFTKIIKTFDINSKIDTIVYSTSSIFQVMLLTNQTDTEIQSFYEKENSNEGYIALSMKKAYSYLREVMKAEHYLSNYFTPLKDMVNLGCDSILKVTEDSILNNFYKRNMAMIHQIILLH